MKVLHFGRFQSLYYGGIPRHVDLLLGGLREHIEVANVVANERWRTETERNAGYPTHHVASLGVLASVPLAPGFPAFVRRLWYEQRFDIAHLHFPDPLSHLSAAAMLPADARIVVTWHSDIVRQKALLSLYQPLVDRFLRRVEAVVAATPLHFATSTQLAAVKGSAKCRVIPYGIDPAPFRATAALQARARELRRPLGARPVVFAVGRHVYYKGFEYLIRAMRDVDGVLLLGGTGPLFEAHRALAAELGIADKVVLAGQIDEAHLAAYYRACDVFCMPSVAPSEAFGLVQLEAMASERPIVNCALGNGVNFVAPHEVNALTVPPRDPGALAGALNALFADPARRARMAERGLERVARMFDVDAMVGSHLALYRELAGRPGERRQCASS